VQYLRTGRQQCSDLREISLRSREVQLLALLPVVVQWRDPSQAA